MERGMEIKGLSLSSLVAVTDMHGQREPPPPSPPPYPMRVYIIHKGSSFISIWKQPHQ